MKIAPLDRLQVHSSGYTDTIEAFKSSPDCFIDAVGHLGLRCEEMESSQEGRVDGTLRFSLSYATLIRSKPQYL